MADEVASIMNLMSESVEEPMSHDFDCFLRLEFHGTKVTGDRRYFALRIAKVLVPCGAVESLR